MSDNCDYNFVTFDDFGKMAKKYTHNMILMSRYKGQLHGGKMAKTFGQGPPPSFWGNGRQKTLFYRRCFLPKKSDFFGKTFPNIRWEGWLIPKPAPTPHKGCHF